MKEQMKNQNKNIDKAQQDKSIDHILREFSRKYLRTYPAIEVEETYTQYTGSDSWDMDIKTRYGLFDSSIEHYNDITAKYIQDNNHTRVQVDFETKNRLSKENSLNDCRLNTYWLGNSYKEKKNPSKAYLTSLFARAVAEEFHKDQKRKVSKEPYFSHLKAVADSVKHDDYVAKSIAWLHDIVEDTEVTLEHIERYFGKEIASGVNYLTRNVDRSEYKRRLLKAPAFVQKIKLYDTRHNVSTLEHLDEHAIRNKVVDCSTFYVPLAFRLEEKEIANDLSEGISPYMLNL
jgi:hypothetical protein